MKEKIRILVSFGTRPEGIKMAPLIKEIQSNPKTMELFICSTGQHREMLKQVIDFFEIKPDIELNLMMHDQTLGKLSSKIIESMESVFNEVKPDIVIVQGDTTTAFLTAFVAFYQKIKIGHVEAGLRTYNKFSPFPEEINRQLLSKITDLHFAPTKSARKNLLREGFNKKSIILTGNTIVDAMEWGIKKINDYNFLKKSEEINNLEKTVDIKKKIILVTMHRRESFGEDIKNVCEALKFISNKYNDVEIIYPVHLNPNVIEPVNKILSGEKNIKLIKPLSYEAFLWLMNKSYLIITDSGGIQEEVPSFKKPVLVIRDFTERNESVKLGLSKLVGTKTQNIINNISLLLESKKDYEKMIADKNPYGDGNASKRIVLAILNYFKENNQEYD